MFGPESPAPTDVKALRRAAVFTCRAMVIATIGSGSSWASTWTSQGLGSDTGLRYTKADVKFMQGMIGHHAQAIVMADLVPTRRKLEAISLIAQRIDISQKDEIKLMQRWLADRGQTVPNPGTPHDHHAGMSDELMPGMLTPEELATLRAAKGSEFDRLFLTFMIRHHEGALTMVASLFSTPGAGQGAEIFQFASDVDADQRAEIKRMRALLDTMAQPKRRP